MYLMILQYHNFLFSFQLNLKYMSIYNLKCYFHLNINDFILNSKWVLIQFNKYHNKIFQINIFYLVYFILEFIEYNLFTIRLNLIWYKLKYGS